MQPRRSVHLEAFFALALFALAACRTTNLDEAYAAHDAGAFQQAAELVSAIEPRRGHDTVWVLLERGKMLQDAGRWEESNVAFQRADEIIETLDEAAVVSLGQLSNVSTALLSDDRGRDYEGSGFDRILLGVGLCLNHLMLGEFETAAVYARRQAERQRVAQEKYEREINSRVEREQAARKEGANVTLDGVHKQKDFQSQQARLSQWTSPAYADFSLPYGYYVGAIALGAAQRFGEQKRMAEDLAGMLPDHPAVLDLMDLAGVGERVFVLFENGMAPLRIDQSFPYISPLGLTVVPVPDLRFRRVNRARTLGIESQSGSFETRVVDEVDRLAATEFKEALPGIWLRNVIAVVLKEVATKQLENQIGGWAILAGSLFKATVQPDLRSWRSLPGEHQVAQFERPADGRLVLRLRAPAGAYSPATELLLPPGPSLVLVRSTGAGNMVAYVAPLSDTAFPVRPPSSPHSAGS